jgi:xanthine/CO dehydrogenase XdhC/CoxF family maturation factor
VGGLSARESGHDLHLEVVDQLLALEHQPGTGTEALAAALASHPRMASVAADVDDAMQLLIPAANDDDWGVARLADEEDPGSRTCSERPAYCHVRAKIRSRSRSIATLSSEYQAAGRVRTSATDFSAWSPSVITPASLMESRRADNETLFTASASEKRLLTRSRTTPSR